MHSRERFIEIGIFLGEYASHLMGCGVHTSRVVRNTKRLGEALEVNVTVSLFQRTLTISIYDIRHNRIHSELVEIPKKPILFSHNSHLSALSWNAYDNKLSLEEIKDQFEKIKQKPLLNPWLIVFLAALANLSFCKLFGGAPLAMLIVFIDTAVGFRTRQLMTKWKCNHYLTIITSAFVASLIASTSFLFETTSEIAMITSILYLIPGVPLINGIIDIVEGYTLMGVSRLINAFLMIVCISVGLGATLMMFSGKLL